jgi:hypothetical protein
MVKHFILQVWQNAAFVNPADQDVGYHKKIDPRTVQFCCVFRNKSKFFSIREFNPIRVGQVQFLAQTFE